MAAELTHLVAQQLIDIRPSPTLELNRTLETGTPSIEQPSAFLSPGPTKTAPGQQAPPSTPTTATTPAKRPALTRADDSTPVSKRTARQADESGDANTSSPKGAKDIFSMSTDRQLSDMYKFVEEIGYGNWGSVWKVQQKHAPNRTEAVKLVFRVKEDKTTPARVRSIWQEFKVIRSFKGEPHPNIIRFYDFIITPSYALVTMDIHNKLMPTNVAESIARSYFSGLLSGIDYLHTHGVTHNDIKPANILLSSEDQPVIVDFGFANRWSLDSDHTKTAFHTNLSWGTPEYLSPERASQKLHDERLADIWSLGITMYEIVVGRTPFEKDNTEEFTTKDALEVYYNRTLTGQFHGHYRISLAFEDLIRQMVEPSVARRLPSCAKGLLHPFFSLRPPSVMATASTNTSPFAMPSIPLPLPPIVVDEPVQALSPVKPATVSDNSKTSSPTVEVFAKPRAPAVSTARKPAPSPISPPNKKAASTPKKNRGLKVFQDSPKGKPADAVSANQAKQTGLRPLLLRPDTSQSTRSSTIYSKSSESQINGPLTSTPKKVLGDGTSVANGLSNRASTTRSLAGTPSKRNGNQAANGIMLGASIRDSKEIRSPESIRVFRATVDDKENASPMKANSLKRYESPRTAGKPVEVRQAHIKEASPPPFTTNIVPLNSSVPSQAMIQPVERPYKLSKRRPSMKSQKSTSALSFHSISSTFRSNKGKAQDERSASAMSVQDDYAFVERDGRVSSDGEPRPFEYGKGQHPEILHIRKPDGDKQEIIQERIISPQAQREHGEAIASARSFERSFMSRSNSVSSSYKRLPEVPIPPIPSPPPVPREPIASPTIKIRRSMAPSFASRPSTKAESERCDSRQSDFSEGSIEATHDENDVAESISSEQRDQVEDATATYVPAIQVSRPYSVSSAARVRSCWSPETCESETIESEDEGNEAMNREDEGDDTIHAAPIETRRTSGVFQRAPRAESIYQSFICPSPTIEVPVKSYSPAPRTTSLNATWSPSSRAMASPTPEMLREYSDLSKINAHVSPYTLFPPPDDLRSLASPPPRPETSNSRRTIGKMKSFFGRFGFGSSSGR